jgi:predicted small lipoprotein YifL
MLCFDVLSLGYFSLHEQREVARSLDASGKPQDAIGSFAFRIDILVRVQVTGIAMRRLHISLLLALCAIIAACGNKGPLVMPDQKPQTQPQQPAATPAPAQDPGKQ